MLYCDSEPIFQASTVACRQQQGLPIVKRKEIRIATRYEAISVADFPKLELVDKLYYLIVIGILRVEASTQAQSPDLYESSFISMYL